MVHKTKKLNRHQRVRHGKHQKHTHHFLKVYAPYLPLVCSIGILVFSLSPWHVLAAKNGGGVLAYATNTTVSGLLAATNSDRAQNGVAALNLNDKLDAAAQAKANDMAARDYWSHNTPDGNPPWYFFDQAGYAYIKAGENLAYGFATSEDTTTGWMNSPEHRANMLDSAFVDVGFGIANNANYQGTGPETIVVAEYGEPQVAAAQTTAPAQAAPSPPPAAPVAQTEPTPTPAAASPAPAAATTPPPSSLQTSKDSSAAAAPKTEVEPATAKISRIQSLTQGYAPWSGFAAGLLMGVAGIWLLIKHGLGLKRFLLKEERFILHHTMLDSLLISLVGVGIFLIHTAGVIR